MESMEEAYLELVRAGITGSLDTESPEVFRHTKENAIDNINKPQSDMIRTLIGEKRLNNIRECVSAVCENGIKGDFLEAGCWRGGAVLYMKACLKVQSIKNPESAEGRRVFGADLFKDSKKKCLLFMQLWPNLLATLRLLFPGLPSIGLSIV